MFIIENEVKNQNETKKSKKWIRILGIIVAIYIAGVVVFSFLTMPNTHINGVDRSLIKKSEALGGQRDDFEVVLKGRDDKSMKVSANQIDYKENVPNGASIVQNPFTWPMSFFRDSDYAIDYDITYSKEKLESAINDSELLKNVVEPENAYIVYKDSGFEIEKEVMGNKLDTEKLANTIINSLELRKNEIELKDEYINPEIKSDDKTLNQNLKNAKEVENLDITYNFPQKTYELKGKDLVDLFDMDNGQFKLNYDRVYEYFRQMAIDTDTYGTTRTFNATGIGEIQVNPGIYGYQMDVESTADEFYNVVDNKQSGEQEPVYLQEGYTRDENGSDIGNTYIEIDLSRQTMWTYIDGELINETPVVTGNAGMDSATNKGVGKVISKETNKVLNGEDYDGSEYNTPVSYWIPIGWDGEGIHDSDWRSAYGGGIYLSNGSHGCINTPPANAEVIFNNIPYGAPVVVYESSTDYSPQMAY